MLEKCEDDRESGTGVCFVCEKPNGWPRNDQNTRSALETRHWHSWYILSNSLVAAMVKRRTERKHPIPFGSSPISYSAQTVNYTTSYSYISPHASSFHRQHAAHHQYAYLNHIFSLSVKSSNACFSPSFSSIAIASRREFSRRSIKYNNVATATRTA